MRRYTDDPDEAHDAKKNGDLDEREWFERVPADVDDVDSDGKDERRGQ